MRILLAVGLLLAAAHLEAQTCQDYWGACSADWCEISTPDTPAANCRRLFVDSATGEMSVRTDAGTTVSLEGGGSGAPTGSKYIVAQSDAGLSAEIAPASDDQIPLSSSSSTAAWVSVPDCDDSAGNHLNYDTGTNAFSCGTTSSGGGSTPTGTGYRHVTAGVEDAASDTVTFANSSEVQANQGTTTTVLHGNAAGQPAFSSVVSADMNITTTSCTNQFVTAISAGAVGTCTTDTLASAQHANQGTTTTVLHGNAAGNPAFGAVVTGDITDGTVAYADIQNIAGLSAMGRSANSSGVGADITGTAGQVLRVSAAPTLGFGSLDLTQAATVGTSILPVANGGTNLSTAADDNVMVGSGATWQSKVLTDCTGAGKAVTYSAGINGFGCNTITAGNVAESSIAVTSVGMFFQTTVTGQAWVTATSIITCDVLGTTADGLTPETIAVAGLTVTLANRVAGTGYDLMVGNPNGLEGTVRIHCIGV